MTGFLLRTLGTLQLERDTVLADDVEPVLRGGKPLALLAYLALEGRRPIERGVLADLLWGDESPEMARGSLRQAVFVLRRALGDDILRADRETVALASERVRTDLALCDIAATAGDLDALLTLYRGPFLSQPPISGASAFERWVDAVREHRRRDLAALVARVLAREVAEGAIERAAAHARQAVEVEPLLERVVVPAVDALASAGALDEANALLERLRAECARVDAPVPPSVSSRLTRFARTLAARPESVEQGEGQAAPGQEFVGRRDELAALFRALERARAGASSSVAILGPAGIGKSRLLDEFEARLRARGARVVRVRFLGGMRAIPFAALGEVVRALTAMPGAMGVSEETAAVLVTLLPELRVKFAGAPPRSRAEDALVPARAQAITDLIAALCEDGALVLLCDDDQHLDEPSRQVLDAALARRAPRLCVVRASRQSTMRASGDEIVIDLGPLSVADVGGLLGDARDADPLATRLQQATGGIPQMVLLTIRALIAERVLRFSNGHWAIEGGALERLDAIAPPLVEQVRTLTPEERLALRTLALWRRPIAEEELRQLLRTLETGVTDASWRHAISALEGRGFVMLRLDAWVPAHDLVVEAVLEASTPEERVRVLRAFALLALPAGPPAIARMEHVMQVFGAQDALAPALLLLRVAAREPSVRAVGLRGRALAERLAVVSGRAEWRPAFDRALGWWGRRRSRERVLLAVAGTVSIGVCGWLIAMLQPRLVVESVPMMNAASPDGVGFVVQPRVGMYDGFGRSITWLETVVRAEANVGEVTGDPLRTTEQGRAQFERLSVPGAVRPENGSPGVEFRFSGPWWLRPVRVHPTGVVWENQDTFRLIRASVDGTPVPPDGEISITPSGDSLLVVVTFEFSATYATANYVVGATPTWGDPRRSGVRLAGLPRPVRAAWQTVGFRVARPATPGRHHIIFAMDAEGSAEHVLSQTNWTAGEPVWGDGNDLAMLPLERIEQLRREGTVASLGVLHGGYETPLGALWTGDTVRRDVTRPRDAYRQSSVMGAVIALRVDSPK